MMTKDAALAHIRELYRAFNMADSDNPERCDWTRPEMAATCCRPLDKMLHELLTPEEIEVFYANL